MRERRICESTDGAILQPQPPPCEKLVRPSVGMLHAHSMASFRSARGVHPDSSGLVFGAARNRRLGRQVPACKVVAHDDAAAQRELLHGAVDDLDAGQQQRLHVARRQVLGQADGVLRLDDVGPLVDRFQQLRIFGFAHRDLGARVGTAADRLAPFLGAHDLPQPIALPGFLLDFEPALAGDREVERGLQDQRLGDLVEPPLGLGAELRRAGRETRPSRTPRRRSRRTPRRGREMAPSPPWRRGS